MIRRFFRWLARREIAEAKAAAETAIHRDALVALEQARMLGDFRAEFAFRQGQENAIEQMGQIVRERMAGGDDVIMPEDIERARKGILH